MSYKKTVEKEAKECVLYYINEITQDVYDYNFSADSWLDEKTEEYIERYPAVDNYQEAFDLLVELKKEYTEFDFDICNSKYPLDYLVECANTAFVIATKRKVEQHLKSILEFDWDSFILDIFNNAINECYYLSPEEKEDLIDYLSYEIGADVEDLINTLEEKVLEEDYYFDETDFIPTEEEIKEAIREEIESLLN